MAILGRIFTEVRNRASPVMSKLHAQLNELYQEKIQLTSRLRALFGEIDLGCLND